MRHRADVLNAHARVARELLCGALTLQKRPARLIIGCESALRAHSKAT